MAESFDDDDENDDDVDNDDGRMTKAEEYGVIITSRSEKDTERTVADAIESRVMVKNLSARGRNKCSAKLFRDVPVDNE